MEELNPDIKKYGMAFFSFLGIICILLLKTVMQIIKVEYPEEKPKEVLIVREKEE